MSTTMLTVPRLLYTLNAPPSDSAAMTAFGVGGSPGAGFRLAASGNSPSGYTVRKVGSDA